MVKHTTVRAMIKNFQTSGTVANLPGRGRKCILSQHTVRIEMVREAKKNPRTTVQELQSLVVSWGSQSLKINHKTPPPYQQALWKGCTKKALTESNQQIQASEVCQMSLDLWLEQGAMVRWDQNVTRKPFWHVWHQKRDAYKEKHLIPTVKNMVVDNWCFGAVLLPVVQGLLFRAMA